MAIGVEHPEAFPDSAFTASSEFVVQDGFNHGAHQSRLNSAGSWAAARGGANSDWIQVDLAEPRSLVGIETQGSHCGTDPAWVEAYTIQYSIDGFDVTMYESVPGTFTGNTHCGDKPVRNEFSSINARYVKIWPAQVHARASMRFELFEGTPFP